MSEPTPKWSGPTGARPKPQPVADREAKVQAAREALDHIERRLRDEGMNYTIDYCAVVREALR